MRIHPTPGLTALFLLLAATLPGSAQEQPGPAQEPARMYLLAGIGFPELVHVSIGYFVTPRLSVDLKFGNVVFNNLVGIGVTAYPRGDRDWDRGGRGLVLAADARINATEMPIRLSGHGELLAAALTGYVGYRFRSERDFLADARIGGLLYSDNGRLGAGPVLLLGVGRAF